MTKYAIALVAALLLAACASGQSARTGTPAQSGSTTSNVASAPSGARTEPTASCPSNDCTPPEGGQGDAAQRAQQGSSAAPTTAAAAVDGPGKYFKEAQPVAVKDHFCGVVQGPIGWPTWPGGITEFDGKSSNPTGLWDIAQSDEIGLPPSTDADCPAELSFFRDFFANSADIQQFVTSSGNFEYHFRGSNCWVEAGFPVPDLKCPVVDRSQLHDALIDRFTAYPR